MAMLTSQIQCLNCDEKEDILECKGCLNIYCIDCLTKHREQINENLNQLQDNCNLFKQNINDTKNNNYFLIEQINKWEQESINIIKETANISREKINNYIINIENKLNNLSEQTKQIRKGNKLNEILLNQLIEKLEYLKKELDYPSKFLIKQQSTAFIDQIFIIEQSSKNNRWKQDGLTIAGGEGQGNQLNQLYYPYGIFIDDYQTVNIADRYNNRIIEWKSNTQYGRIVAGGNECGKQTNQLNHPTNVISDKENNCFIIADRENRRIMRWSREKNTTNGEIILDDIDCWDLTVDKDGSLYVSDWKKNEVKRWKRGETNGTIVAGGNGQGDQLNQFNLPTFIFVDDDYSLYVSDRDNHRVMKWLEGAKNGIIVAGGNGGGNSLKHLSYPYGVVVDQLGQIYVADSKNNRVMCWCDGDKEGRIVVGGNGQGEELNQLSYPRGLSFDIEGNLYVVDCWNNRIQKFEIDLN